MLLDIIALLGTAACLEIAYTNGWFGAIARHLLPESFFKSSEPVRPKDEMFFDDDDEDDF